MMFKVLFFFLLASHVRGALVWDLTSNSRVPYHRSREDVKTLMTPIPPACNVRINDITLAWRERKTNHSGSCSEWLQPLAVGSNPLLFPFTANVEKKFRPLHLLHCLPNEGNLPNGFSKSPSSGESGHFFSVALEDLTRSFDLGLLTPETFYHVSSIPMPLWKTNKIATYVVYERKQFEFQHTKELQLSPQARLDIQNLPLQLTKETHLDYFQFLATYGTEAGKSAVFGLSFVAIVFHSTMKEAEEFNQQHLYDMKDLPSASVTRFARHIFTRNISNDVLLLLNNKPLNRQHRDLQDLQLKINESKRLPAFIKMKESNSIATVLKKKWPIKSNNLKVVSERFKMFWKLQQYRFVLTHSDRDQMKESVLQLIRTASTSVCVPDNVGKYIEKYIIAANNSDLRRYELTIQTFSSLGSMQGHSLLNVRYSLLPQMCTSTDKSLFMGFRGLNATLPSDTGCILLYSAPGCIEPGARFNGRNIRHLKYNKTFRSFKLCDSAL